MWIARIVLPFHATVSYYLDAWYFAWLGAPLAVIVNIVVSKIAGQKTPDDICELLATKVHA